MSSSEILDSSVAQTQRLLLVIVSMQTVSPSLATLQHVILATIERLKREPERLHHSRAGSTQILPFPGASPSSRQRKGVLALLHSCRFSAHANIFGRLLHAAYVAVDQRAQHHTHVARQVLDRDGARLREHVGAEQTIERRVPIVPSHSVLDPRIEQILNR